MNHESRQQRGYVWSPNYTPPILSWTLACRIFRHGCRDFRHLL